MSPVPLTRLVAAVTGVLLTLTTLALLSLARLLALAALLTLLSGLRSLLLRTLLATRLLSAGLLSTRLLALLTGLLPLLPSLVLGIIARNLFRALAAFAWALPPPLTFTLTLPLLTGFCLLIALAALPLLAVFGTGFARRRLAVLSWLVAGLTLIPLPAAGTLPRLLTVLLLTLLIAAGLRNFTFQLVGECIEF